MSTRKFKIDICPECKVRENDSSKKRLFKCKYCEDWFCKKHLSPKLAMMRENIEKIKDPILKDKIYKEWRKPEGHPDWSWTKQYLKKLEEDEEKKREKFEEFLNKSKKRLVKKREEVKETPIKEKPLTPIKEKPVAPIKEKPLTPIKPKGIPTKSSSFNKLKNIIKDFFWRIRFNPYNFFKHVLIALTVLVLLHFFFVGKFGLLPLVLRSIGIVLLGYFILFIYRRTYRLIPYKWLFLCIIVIISAHIFSTNDYSILRISDKVLGIEGFTDTVVQKLSQPTSEIIQKPKAVIGIGKSLFHYKTPEEKLNEKILELRNNSAILERKVHELINEQRKKNGLSPLTWDERLAEIARYHSEDMAKRNYFAHESPEGEDLEIRYKKFGYSCRISAGNFIYSGAENILLMYVYDSYYYDPLTGKITEYVFNSLEDIAYETVDGWMGSEGHRKNILTPFFGREGIGIYIDSDGEVYVTEDFC